jgi:hypothetical protein
MLTATVLPPAVWLPDPDNPQGAFCSFCCWQRWWRSDYRSPHQPGQSLWYCRSCWPRAALLLVLPVPRQATRHNAAARH